MVLSKKTGSIVAFVVIAGLFAGMAWTGWFGELWIGGFKQCVKEMTMAKNDTTAKPVQHVQPVELPSVRVTAEQLVSDYEANEVAADEKYKGRKLFVPGIVERIAKDFFGTPYVVLEAGGKYSLTGVQCMFDDGHTGPLANLQKGQRVDVTGKCIGKGMTVLLTGCNLL